MAIQTLTLNVNAQPSAEDRAFLYLSQNENGRDIRFRVLGDDLPSGCTATLSGVKPDGNVWSKAGTVTNNFVVVEEDVQMTAVAGRWDAQLDIVNGSKNIVTALIRITVEAAAVEAGAVPSDTQLEGYVEQCKQYAETAKNEAYGSPLTAATAAAMTDQKRVYVYTGSETGYTAGHWYYYDGTAWTDGGIYNSVAVDTDTTLSISGKAADAKETGDQITDLKSGLNELQGGGYIADAQQIQEKVDNYLDEHPEATTTVQDGAITEAKLNSEVTKKLLSDYYYPEITSWQERLYDTTCYFVSVPARDSDGNIINPYLKYEEDLTPLDHAIANHTTFTCNGTTGCLQSGSIVRGHVISRGRSVFNNTLTSVADTFKYVSINADRTVKDYAVNNTTQTDMLGDGAYNVFCAYYKLIDNSTIVDNSATVNNESKNVSTLYVPYSAIGVMSDNTLLFMAADGGTDIDKGLNSVNAANILLEKGCVNAWAMDGGGSVSFDVRGAKYNRNIDNDGTTDRLVHITLNIKKDSKSDSVTEAFGKIGEEKQNLVKQVIPYINDLYDKHDSLINNATIASGTDLNTITAIGRYAATTSAVAGSLTNSPTTVAFMMEIIKISSTMSFYVIVDYNSDIYVRRNYVYSNANHFSAWKKVTTE